MGFIFAAFPACDPQIGPTFSAVPPTGLPAQKPGNPKEEGPAPTSPHALQARVCSMRRETPPASPVPDASPLAVFVLNIAYSALQGHGPPQTAAGRSAKSMVELVLVDGAGAIRWQRQDTTTRVFFKTPSTVGRANSCSTERVNKKVIATVLIAPEYGRGMTETPRLLAER